jgi:hypothetical protein
MTPRLSGTTMCEVPACALFKSMKLAEGLAIGVGLIDMSLGGKAGFPDGADRAGPAMEDELL